MPTVGPRQIGLFVAAVSVALSSSLSADIAGSKHDLSSEGGGYFTSDISFSCYFCHAVHTPDEGVPGSGGYPMWNKDLSSLGPYSIYSSPTLESSLASPPNVESLACLSCHDGTVALNVIRSGTLGTMSPSAFLGDRPSNLGTDLSNDHPISFSYDQLVDSGFAPLASAVVSGLKFYGAELDQLECATCHDPHDPTYPPFLRVSNAGSTLCLACHQK